MENKQLPPAEQAPVSPEAPKHPGTGEIREGFFLRRPIFSTVISLIITLVGAIAITALPVEQYPNLTPAAGTGVRHLYRRKRRSHR